MRLPLNQAAGLRLAADLLTDRDYPPFRKSLMDGYAVRIGERGAPLGELKVTGEIAAGVWPSVTVSAGEAVAIMTGTPLPEGADAVVPIEQTERLGDSRILIREPAREGQNIAQRGSDARRGQMALSRGSILGPAQIAVASTVGAAEVEVFAPPRVAVLGTGDELVSVEASPAPGQIRNSNTPMLLGLARSMGCEATEIPAAPDDPDAIRAAIQAGLAFEVLFVSGGMSMGRHDHVPKILQELGVTLKITKLHVKPGKPFVFGVHAGGFVFGLPGNPVSAFVCTIRLAARLLARLAGGVPREPWVSGLLERGVLANGPREFYQPAFRSVPAGSSSGRSEFAQITPLNWKGSADLFTLASANALLVRARK